MLEKIPPKRKKRADDILRYAENLIASNSDHRLIDDDIDKASDLFPLSESSSVESFRPASIHVFASNVTMHGFYHIFARHHSVIRRFAWSLAFLASLTLLILQSSNRVRYYLERPHVTKLDEISGGILRFPAVTICNLNEFRFSQITKNDMYWAGEFLGYQNETRGLHPAAIPPEDIENPEEYQKIINRLEKLSDYSRFSPRPDFSLFEFYNRTGIQLEELLLECFYRGKKCGMPDFKTVYTRYGKCYTFNNPDNVEDIKKTLKGGVDNGLELLLDIQQEEYMPMWKESDEISYEAGLKIQIHSQDEPPFIHELGFGISPGRQTLVSTQEQRVTFLPPPWGNCNPEKPPNPHDFFPKYSISSCRIACETKQVVKECGCRMVHMPSLPDTPENRNGSDNILVNTPYCSTSQYKCADKQLDYLVSADNSVCVCKTPCAITRYSKEQSTLVLPSESAIDFMSWKYNRTPIYVKNNFAKLNVYFEALNYETVEQKKAYEVPGLLGDIGGQMGLFIGASILTILELFDYVYEVIKEKSWGQTLRKRKREKEIATARAIIEEYRQRSANIGYEALDQDHESTLDKKPKCVITDIN